jgi:hypothetical protein
MLRQDQRQRYEGNQRKTSFHPGAIRSAAPIQLAPRQS